jgi:hypothetical protein
MFIRRMARVALVVVVPALFAGCPSNVPSQTIVGTWQSGLGEKKRTMTFWDNGVWSFETGPKTTQTGTYQFVSDNQIEIKVDGPSESRQIVYKRIVAFAHHDLMHLTDVQTSMRTTWKRVE